MPTQRHRLLSRSFFCAGLISLIASPFNHGQEPHQEPYKEAPLMSFDALRTQVFSDPYDERPTYTVDRSLFGKSGDRPENKVLAAARRSLQWEGDLFDFPQGQKIFQANGICFSGYWRIAQSSPYTGLYQQGTEVPVIVRASVALSSPLQKHKRAFGMAIKLFPDHTADNKVKTQNVFVMHSLGGRKIKHVLDLTLDNAPKLGALPPFGQWRTMLRLQRDFERADRESSKDKARVAFRSVSELASVSERSNSLVVDPQAPTWLRLRAQSTIPRVDKEDFRDELDLHNYPNEQLVWEIEVGINPEDKKDGKTANKNKAEWLSIGKLTVDASVVSKTCDQRLHFKHPR